LGLCETAPESQLNDVCGLGGSGIAFVCLQLVNCKVYSMIDAMSDGALKMGLPPNISTNFAAQTVLVNKFLNLFNRKLY
jgi:pyrroline-5-carboxylate reductase